MRAFEHPKIALDGHVVRCDQVVFGRQTHTCACESAYFSRYSSADSGTEYRRGRSFSIDRHWTHKSRPTLDTKGKFVPRRNPIWAICFWRAPTLYRTIVAAVQTDVSSTEHCARHVHVNVLERRRATVIRYVITQNERKMIESAVILAKCVSILCIQRCRLIRGEGDLTVGSPPMLIKAFTWSVVCVRTSMSRTQMVVHKKNRELEML